MIEHALWSFYGVHMAAMGSWLTSGVVRGR